MNLDLFLPEKETEELLLSLAKNFGTPNEQTHTKLQETLELNLTQPRQTLSFTSPNNKNSER